MSDTLIHDIRYSTFADGVYLEKWLNTPGMLHWFPVSSGKEEQDAIRCWMGFARYKASLTATVNNTPCGIGTLFLMPYQKVAHHCLFKMIVASEYQRRGIGTSLLKNLKHLAKNYFHLHHMHIEVFEGNPIISLLHKLEFREFARQEKYVKEGDQYFSRILLEVFL